MLPLLLEEPELPLLDMFAGRVAVGCIWYDLLGAIFLLDVEENQCRAREEFLMP